MLEQATASEFKLLTKFGSGENHSSPMQSVRDCSNPEAIQKVCSRVRRVGIGGGKFCDYVQGSMSWGPPGRSSCVLLDCGCLVVPTHFQIISLSAVLAFAPLSTWNGREYKVQPASPGTRCQTVRTKGVVEPRPRRQTVRPQHSTVPSTTQSEKVHRCDGQSMENMVWKTWCTVSQWIQSVGLGPPLQRNVQRCLKAPSSHHKSQEELHGAGDDHGDNDDRDCNDGKEDGT